MEIEIEGEEPLHVNIIWLSDSQSDSDSDDDGGNAGGLEPFATALQELYGSDSESALSHSIDSDYAAVLEDLYASGDFI
ncbi:unnamed protein product [Linum trigynum]|uniref:Uncharacterized protein n=1 Tax=Linum trigynum TaxID=586398 RepID=A0AAV2D700_9ROSI